MANSSKLRISARVTNTKRHTTGYMISGKLYSVSETKALAASGRIAGVRVTGNHVQSIPGRRRLASLPTRVDRSSSNRTSNNRTSNSRTTSKARVSKK